MKRDIHFCVQSPGSNRCLTKDNLIDINTSMNTKYENALLHLFIIEAPQHPHFSSTMLSFQKQPTKTELRCLEPGFQERCILL